MEKTEIYKNYRIKVLLVFNATEHFVRDKNDRNKLLSTLTYDYSQKISINDCQVLHNNGQAFYDEYTQNMDVDSYKNMVLNSCISLGKAIIDGN